MAPRGKVGGRNRSKNLTAWSTAGFALEGLGRGNRPAMSPFFNLLKNPSRSFRAPEAATDRTLAGLLLRLLK
jgi:hypothetical protein